MSVGGAVLFTTTKPGDSFGGYFDVDAGNYNERKFEGAVNLPILSDVVLARVAGFYQRRDGYQYNLFTDSTVGDVDRYGGRTSLTIQFLERLRNDLVADYYHSGGSSAALVLSYVSPLSAKEPPVPANVLYSPFLDTAVGAPGAWAAYVAANPKAPPGGLFAALAAQNARSPFTVDVNNPGAYKPITRLSPISRPSRYQIICNSKMWPVITISGHVPERTPTAVHTESMAHRQDNPTGLTTWILSIPRNRNSSVTRLTVI